MVQYFGTGPIEFKYVQLHLNVWSCVDFDFGSNSWVGGVCESIFAFEMRLCLPAHANKFRVTKCQRDRALRFAYIRMYPLFSLYCRPFLCATYNNIIMESHMKIEQYPLAYVAADISRMRRCYKYYWIVPAPQCSTAPFSRTRPFAATTTATDDDCGKRM